MRGRSFYDGNEVWVAPFAAALLTDTPTPHVAGHIATTLARMV